MAYEVRQVAESAARIIADAGGQVVGRTRLQKIGYMLEALGLGDGFHFDYKHYGPYSEDLTSAVKFATIFDLAAEEERVADWGGSYSIFRVVGNVPKSTAEARLSAVAIGNSADPVNLELAATAVLLANEGYDDPWMETKSRKPDKATPVRLEEAKELVKKFRALNTETKLPENA